LAAPEHANDSYVRGNYLGLVQARVKNDQEVEKVLRATAQWLAAPEHANDSFVRGSYLGLVQARVKNDQEVEKVLQATAQWLAAPEHANDSYVRGNYLGLVQASGKDKPTRVREAIRVSSAWLDQHPDDTHVRAQYLALVKGEGAEDEAKAAIASTEQWLNRYTYDITGNIGGGLLRLVAERDSSQVDRAIQRTRAWLRENPRAIECWTTLITVLKGCQKFTDASDAAQEAVSANPEDNNLLRLYLDRCRKGIPKEKLREIIDKILPRLQGDRVGQLQCANWLSEIGDYEKAQSVFDELTAESSLGYRLDYAYGWHLHRQEKFKEAKEQFQKVLGRQPKHEMALEGLGRSLADLAKHAEEKGDPTEAERLREEAERCFDSAIKISKEQGMGTARFHTARGWLYHDWKRFEEALSEFEQSNGESPHFTNFWGKGAALVALKKYSEALKELKTALALAPQPLEPPASEEIPRLIAECEKALNYTDLR
jgi:tetratricopeptide (TPR) repeat protein